MRTNRWMLGMVLTGAMLQLTGCSKGEVDALAAAKAKIEKKQDSAAEIDLKNLLQKFPKSAEARFLLGLQIQKRGDPAAALIEFQRALDLKHPDSIVVPAIARALMAQGKNRQVINEFGTTSFNDAIATAELQALVAQALAAEGDAAGAMALIDKAAAGAPTSEPVLLTQASLEAQAGQFDQALVVLDALIAKKPDSHLAWTMKGNVQGVNPATIDAAMQSFSTAIGIKGGEISPRTGLIALSLQRGDIDGAQRELEQLKKIAPKVINTQYYEARLSYTKGRYMDAQLRYQAILRVLPLHPQVLLAAAENELQLNATAQAGTLVAKVLAQAPDDLRARQLQAQVYLRMGQPAKAIAALSSAVDSPRATPELLALAAQAELMNGNPAAANQMYVRMAKLKPSDPRLRTLIASSGFGKVSDDTVFAQLQQIARDDSGDSADMALISAHLSRKQFDAALRALTSLDRKRPGDPLPHHLRGQILVTKADLTGARGSFEAAVKINAAYFPSVAALAALDARDNNLDAAQQRFTDLLKTQPKDARAMLAIAELMELQQKPQAEVRKQIEAAVKATPNDVSARVALISHRLATGQLDAAVNAAQAATAEMPDNIELLALQGRCLMRVNQIQQAISSYSKVVTLDPKSSRGHIGLADVYLQANDLDQAQRSADRALELSPGLAEAKAQTIMVAIRRQKFDQAVSIARSVQADHPQEGKGLLLEAEVEMRRSNWQAAAAVLRKALDKPFPELAATKLYAALVRGGKTNEAHAFSQQWLKQHPQDANFLLTAAEADQAMNNFAAAERRYRQLLAAQPNHVSALNNLAMALLQQKKPGATPLAEQAVRLAPDRAELLDTLAQAQAGEMRLSQAVETQKRAVALAPQAADLHLNLARLLIQAGDKPLALAELDALARRGASYESQDEVARLRQSLAPVLPRQ